MLITEDMVRNESSILLGFNDQESEVQQGCGQITTFNQLGFKGIMDKPDGWYLPNDKSKVAIILETKSSSQDVNVQKWVDELFKNIKVANQKYSTVVGILWNGKEIRVFENFEEILDVSPQLENKDYYIKLVSNKILDKNHIYKVTKRINDSLHFDFGMNDLQDRMIFTACALVAQRYNSANGLERLKGMGYSIFKNWIYDALSKAIEKDKQQNNKLDILLEEYIDVRLSITENQESINQFIDDVCEISTLVNSDNWNGEDVMAIFFNEFNRYRKKTDAGQVFTPDHLTSFMYRLIDIDMNDRVLDATCGSGAFLVKSMSNMIQESGGVNTKKAQSIKSKQLFGIEMYRKVFALACANMMIHKDGKTNLEQLDARTPEAASWISEKKISKVLMNPPFERKYGCIKIVTNILNNVPPGTKCAFILPDKKLEVDSGGKKLLKNHTLETIIKLPENVFIGKGVTTSIFVFTSGKPQKNNSIIGYHIEDDGLETVKNQGRHDIYNKWQSIEDYWIKAIRDSNDYKFNTRQIINPNEHLSYQMPEKPFILYEENFLQSSMDNELYLRKIDIKEFEENLLQKILYSGKMESNDSEIVIKFKK